MTTTTPYIVVGSDDPAVTYPLNAPQRGRVQVGHELLRVQLSPDRGDLEGLDGRHRLHHTA
jgi:hypothetical protein